jgi:hypothetical protein
MTHYFLVFNDNNVEIHPPDITDLDVFPMGTWALSGSNEEPCPAFQCAAEWQIAWMVLTTSPSEKKWGGTSSTT